MDGSKDMDDLHNINKRTVGRIEETLAAQFLQQHGVRIVERNFHDSRFGEIDLIGYEGRTLLFIEVKYRCTDLFGLPEEAVTFSKQRTISLVAKYYIHRHRLEGVPVRFDVVAIMKVDERTEYVKWIRDAFPYRGR